MQNLLKTEALGTLPDRLPVTIAGRTRRVYDLVAGVYPLSTMFFHSKAHRCALSQSGIRNGMKVLEIATGSGEMFRRLVQANPDGTTVGLDLSPNMAARTQHHVCREFPKARARCQAVDARYLPFKDASFDAVMCCYLLELLSRDDIFRALEEVSRVLKPGGAFTLITIGQDTDFFNRLYYIASSVVPAFWGRQVEQEVPSYLHECRLHVEQDRVVRQSGYPSRVTTARKVRR